eukprot:Rhum_TRINITY_DN14246_c8_g2::Rhum_TRINITY_DN14246_c8_g2_i1::g.75739::m.75739
MQTHAWEKLEGVERAGVEHRWAEELGDLEWHFARQYAHVCEVGRRRLMEEEERARRLVQAREEAEVARAMDRYLKAIEDAEAAPGLADALGSDEEDDDDDDLPSPESPSPGQERRRVTVAAGVGEVLYYDDGDDDGSPHRGTQTPSYGYVGGDGGAGGGGDARISAELQKLRKELHHERELRERATERMSEHERVMKQRSSQLEDRERRLLEKLSKDHASRLEEVRTVLQPRVEKAAAFDEADRVLRVMNEREAEWADRERAWTLLQAEMDAEARRLRDELARASQLHWQAEEEKAELKGRSDANDVEMAAMRNTIDRADDRLRHVLLEEQELLCKVEEQWKARCDAAEAELAEAEAKAARRLDERERQMLRQERALRQRCESAEKDRLEMLGRLETLQVRGEAAERERRSLRDELGAEAHLAGHRATAEVRAARSALDRERRLRAEAEEALGAAQRELERLGTQLEDARLRRTQQHREAQLAAAEHEAELARAQALVPDRATRFSILTAVETAARYATISQHNEGLTDLLHHFYRGCGGGGGPRRGASASLAEHNGMLRELLALEEAKVAELERAVAEVRRQRNELAGQVQHPAGFFDAQARVVLAEAEARAGVEAACRAALVDCLTTRRRGNAPSPQPPPPPQTPQLPTPLAARVEAPLQPPPDPSAACHGWLLACLETPSFGGRGFQRTQWKQLYVWVDHADGLLRYSPVAGGEAGAAAGGQPVGSVDLRNVVAVEIEMFTDPSEQPPPVSRYQQLGFYVEMGVSGAKHRFCASSVPERTAWLDHVRRTVLKHSSVWSARWDPAHTPPQSVAAAASPPQTLRSAVRSHSRERRLRKPVFLEHLSYLSMED